RRSTRFSRSSTDWPQAARRFSLVIGYRPSRWRTASMSSRMGELSKAGLMTNWYIEAEDMRAYSKPKPNTTGESVSLYRDRRGIDPARDQGRDGHAQTEAT